MKWIILILLILMTIPNVSAAIVQGKVYDLSLNKLSNVVVEINTIPKQRVISNEGEYFFNVPKGDYSITTRAIIEGIEYTVNENISVIDDGNYIIDLFLFPELDEPPKLNVDIDNNKGRSIIIYLISFAIIFLIIFFSFKRGGKSESQDKIIDDSLNEIYNLIKKEKRTTQKEIRKKSSLSEAKISLIITQLEKEGRIQKIKKGRTNIIILKQ